MFFIFGYPLPVEALGMLVKKEVESPVKEAAGEVVEGGRWWTSVTQIVQEP